QLLDAAKGTRLYVPILVAVTTGLRRGELLALRWRDLDFDSGTLTVRQSLEQTRDGLRFKQPKTSKSRRTVALSPITVDALRRHKAEQAKERLLMGPAYQDQGLIFAQADGRPVSPNSFSAAFCDL